MKIFLALLLSILCFAAYPQKQKTTLRRLTPIAVEKDATTRIRVCTPADSSMITFSGFDKPLSSNYETFFAFNNTPDTITTIWLTATYTTMQGTMLHRRPVAIATRLLPAERLMLRTPSFDRQHSFFYHKSRRPRNLDSTSPFRVTLRLDSVEIL